MSDVATKSIGTEKAPSSGKTAMIGITGGAAAVTVFMYVAKHTGFADMDDATASAFVTLLGGIPSWILHVAQRNKEKKEQANA